MKSATLWNQENNLGYVYIYVRTYLILICHFIYAMKYQWSYLWNIFMLWKIYEILS